jgi:hypothetical protein
VTWETRVPCPANTDYANDGASRIDRIYATEPVIQRKQGAETVAAASSDHFVVIVRMAFDTPSRMCRARVWRINITLLEETISRIHQGTMGKVEEICTQLPEQTHIVVHIC